MRCGSTPRTSIHVCYGDKDCDDQLLKWYNDSESDDSDHYSTLSMTVIAISGTTNTK